jgi:uncharacterized zinc-type alcohol dehydrogenase-like protein
METVPSRSSDGIASRRVRISSSASSLSVAFRRRVAGTKNGGIRQTQEMLDFCAEHGLGAEIEVIPAEKITEAWDRVVACDVRYRFVIDTSPL